MNTEQLLRDPRYIDLKQRERCAIASSLTGGERVAYHAAASIFPGMHEDEMDALVDHVRRNGLLEPIWTYDGQIIDGRHRYEACLATDTEPQFREYQGDESTLIAFVIGLNLMRRHLTEAQKATIAVEALPLYEAAARERQGRRTDLDANPDFVENFPQSRSVVQAAEAAGTNARYVSGAKRIKTDLPLVYELMREGLLNIPAAREVEKIPVSDIQDTIVDELVAGTLKRHSTDIKRRSNELRREAAREEDRQRVAAAPSTQQVAIAGERFSCLVLDPPWDWGDEGDADQFGRARPDYATLSIEDIAALPIGDLADDNAHIYLWITNRSLPKGFNLLSTWGFRYITTLTWCKPHFGMGNYFRGQTEQILFGVRGSLPLLRHDVGTYFTAPRGENGHSSKPDAFYELVESCTPGPWLELFSRCERQGWKRWGERRDAYDAAGYERTVA